MAEVSQRRKQHKSRKCSAQKDWMGIGSLRMMSRTTSMGFEPTRGDPNGLAVHRLNRSATMSSTLCLHPSVQKAKLSIVIHCCPNILHTAQHTPVKNTGMSCSVDIEDVGFTRAEMFSQPLAGTVDRYLYTDLRE